MDDSTPYLPTVATLEVVLQAIPGPRVVVGEDETILLVNQAACELLGYSAEELVGHSVDILRPEGREAQIDDLRLAWAAAPEPGRLGAGMDLRARRSDGSEVPIELQVLPWRTDEGDVMVVVMHDLTKAQYDGRLFRALLDATPDSVVIIDAAGRIRLVNSAAERCFGYERGELVGKPMEILVPDRVRGMHSHLRQHFAEAPHPRPMGSVSALYAKRRDGSEFPADISLSPVETEEGPLVIAEVRDLTERLAAIEALNKAQEERRVLTEIERVKDQFLATVSHELRTPLASIIGFCELISEIDALDPEVRHFMSIVTRNARREARLVDDLLTLVNIDRGGGLSVRPASVNLNKVVHDAVSSARPQATAADIDLSLEAPADPTPIVCDPDRIGQALDNLLSNAVKFTPAGGRVHVTVQVGPGSVSVTVADTGMGIDDPEPARVFERLYRSPLAVQHEIPGAGIGLSIAAAIATAHGGNLSLVATSPQGTTFAIELPLDGVPRSTMVD